METDFLANGNRFLFVQRFFLLLETVTETRGSPLWMKEQNLFNVADFLAIGTHFLLFSQTTVASRNSSFFNWNIFFSQSFISAGGNKFFVRVFFCLWNYYCERGNIFLLVNTYCFFIFSEILRFLKVGATFPCSEDAFFDKFFIRLVKTDFLSSGDSGFWSELFFC